MFFLNSPLSINEGFLSLTHPYMGGSNLNKYLSYSPKSLAFRFAWFCQAGWKVFYQACLAGAMRLMVKFVD
jgi:hypothetical protein